MDASSATENAVQSEGEGLCVDDKTPEVMDPIVDLDEVMYRQVSLGFYKLGRLTRQAFKPFPRDGKLLSTDRSTKSNPESAFVVFTSRGLISRGTWGVSVRECADVGLRCIWNPNPKDLDGKVIKNEAHSLIDFRTILSNSKIDTLSAQLSRIADDRGCLFENPTMSAETTVPPEPNGGQTSG